MRLIFTLDLVDLETTIRELYHMIPTSEPCESNPSICEQELSLEFRLRKAQESYIYSITKINSNTTLSINDHSDLIYLPSSFEEIKHGLDVDVTNLLAQIDSNNTVSNYSQWLNLAQICVTRIEETIKGFSEII